MSLLQDEEFAIYQLRTSYLAHIKDGVGERLININTNVLNNAAFRASGWQPHGSEIKRTYSPPIPTAVTAEYFQQPRHIVAPRLGLEDDEIGMVTGVGSNETVGPTIATRRRRKREQLQQDDSSELSDESDDEDLEPKAPNTIRFEKLPLRARAGSSPLRNAEGPEVTVTTPSKPDGNPLRAMQSKTRPRRDTTTTATSSEMSTAEVVDNTDHELESVFLQRKPISSRRARASRLLTDRIQEDEREGDESLDEVEEEDEEEDDEDEADPSAGSLSSAFIGSVPSSSSLGPSGALGDSPLSTRSAARHKVSPRKQRIPPVPIQKLPSVRPISVVKPVSLLTRALKGNTGSSDDPFARYAKFSAIAAQAQEKPLSIKIYAPASKTPSKPFEIILSRNNDSKPVSVVDAIGFALYRYTEEKLEPPITGEKASANKWNFRMVDDGEVEYDFPALTRTSAIADFTSNNNRGPRGRSREKPWDEFALVEATDKEFKENEESTPQHTQSTSQESSQAPSSGAPPAIPQIHSAPTPGLAVPYQNPITRPHFPFASPSTFSQQSHQTQPNSNQQYQPYREGAIVSNQNASAAGFGHPAPQQQHLDTPVPNIQRAMRTGQPRTLRVRYADEATALARTTLIEATTDTYLAEIFEQACFRFRIEKALYVLRVSGSSTIVPHDRIVEALGDHLELELTRRRFLAGHDRFILSNSLGVSGGAGSSSSAGGGIGTPVTARTNPNEPLLIASAAATPARRDRLGSNAAQHHQLLAGLGPPNSMMMMSGGTATAALGSSSSRLAAGVGSSYPGGAGAAAAGGGANSSHSGGMQAAGVYRRYNVIRKQPMSFSSSSTRVIMLDGEFMHIMPHEGPKAVWEKGGAGKSSAVPFSNVIGCKVIRKHPRTFRVTVFKERENKRYDFEAVSIEEAAEIVDEIRRGMEANKPERLFEYAV